MCKAVGHEELTVVVLREFHGNMLAEGRTAPADIHRHVEDCPPDTAHQFGLGVGHALVVQSAHHAIRTHGLVVLHEMYVTHLLAELLFGEGFEKIAAFIGENTWFDDERSLNMRLDYFHVSCRFFIHTRRLSVQYGTRTANVSLTFVLSSTLYAGRFTGLGNS